MWPSTIQVDMEPLISNYWESKPPHSRYLYISFQHKVGMAIQPALSLVNSIYFAFNHVINKDIMDGFVKCSPEI